LYHSVIGVRRLPASRIQTVSWISPIGRARPWYISRHDIFRRKRERASQSFHRMS
jgi:hypothetical protein